MNAKLVRGTHLPRKHPDGKGMWAREACGILKLAKADQKTVNYRMPRLHVYNQTCGELRRLDLQESRNRALMFSSMLKELGILVYKNGAATYWSDDRTDERSLGEHGLRRVSCQSWQAYRQYPRHRNRPRRNRANTIIEISI
jgi:hypothetical protein